jgi:hypothetical protein
VAEI